MNNLYDPPIPSNYHKSLDHLIELDLCTCTTLDSSSQTQVKIHIQDTLKIEGHQDLIMMIFIHSSTYCLILLKKRLLSFKTPISYDARCAPRALSNRKE